QYTFLSCDRSLKVNKKLTSRVTCVKCLIPASQPILSYRTTQLIEKLQKGISIVRQRKILECTSIVY
ncbi:hypothetical protein M5D96_009478, partial [Drosophila gunungcola]